MKSRSTAGRHPDAAMARISASALLLFAAARAEGQALPPPANAGQLLQQNQSLLSPDVDTARQSGSPDDTVVDTRTSAAGSGTAMLHVKRFELNEPLGEPLDGEVARLFAGAAGRDLTFEQITAVRLQLNALLRRHLGLLVFAVLPEQDASNGVVRFRIVRGHVESIELNNRSRVSNATLERVVPGAGKSGAALLPITRPDLNDLQQAAQIARALPGVAAVTPMLTQGETEGGTRVVLDVAPEPAIEAAVIADNGGSPSTGRYRVGAQVTANSPLGIGDRARVLAYNAPSALQDRDGAHGKTWIGLASYDVPLGGAGTRGGVQYSRVQYALGGPLQDLGDGYADVVGAYVRHPLISTSRDDLSVGVAYNRKLLKDSFFSYAFRRRSNVASITLNGSHFDDWKGRPNGLQYALSVDAGDVRQLEVGLGDPSTQGPFVKWGGSADFTQTLWLGANVRARMSAQFANRHLDPSEQMSLGGPNAVRAYGYDAPSVDQGAVASVDLTQQIAAVPGLSARVFVDAGRGQINKSRALAGADNTWNARGYGVGASYQYKARARVDVSHAFRAGAPAGQRPASGQTWVTATVNF
ncbi:ShlB/FhaC/HecB family hemolysin secretion/activation protein [Burkholderia catarinensis]|uniref:ShlB/FhaC/HecB family hemolysin secretion/activation protein n=1 Tax=Burkholderia catarinensis TaxID=1108140 RepID=UPI0010085C7E|nr:ShlB/FhaC/HecB family hemolysin secretion/activation protein [Burkholderia catarinensis]